MYAKETWCAYWYMQKRYIFALKCMYTRPTSSQIGVCKRNVYHSKETYITQKRPTSSQIGVCKRNAHHFKATYITQKRRNLIIANWCMQQRRISLKRDVYRRKLVYAKETHVIFGIWVCISVCAYTLTHYCKFILDIIAYWIRKSQDLCILTGLCAADVHDLFNSCGTCSSELTFQKLFDYNHSQH